MTERPPSVREVRSVRVQAPLRMLWEEVAVIDALLTTERISDVRSDADHTSARFRARLKWGPFGWDLDGSAKVLEADHAERVTMSLEIPVVRMTQRVTFELVAVSATETNLDVVADFDLGRLANRARSVVDLELESYVRGMVDGVGSRAERHWKAQQRLANRETADDG